MWAAVGNGEREAVRQGSHPGAGSRASATEKAAEEGSLAEDCDSDNGQTRISKSGFRNDDPNFTEKRQICPEFENIWR